MTLVFKIDFENIFERVILRFEFSGCYTLPTISARGALLRGAPPTAKPSPPLPHPPLGPVRFAEKTSRNTVLADLS